MRAPQIQPNKPPYIQPTYNIVQTVTNGRRMMRVRMPITSKDVLSTNYSLQENRITGADFKNVVLHTCADDFFVKYAVVAMRIIVVVMKVYIRFRMLFNSVMVVSCSVFNSL